MDRPRRVRARVFVLGLLAVLALPVAAQAQLVPVEVHVANDIEQWDPGQYAFDPYAETSIFIVMSTQQHPGYTYSGTCVLSLAATYQELYRVRIDGLWIQPGQDVARTPSFRMQWPQAAVTVTCSPDWAPAQAISATLGPELWNGAYNTGYGPGYYPQPIYAPAPVYTPPPAYPPAPVYTPPPAYTPPPVYSPPPPTTLIVQPVPVVIEQEPPVVYYSDPAADALFAVDLMLHFMSGAMSIGMGMGL